MEEMPQIHSLHPPHFRKVPFCIYSGSLVTWKNFTKLGVHWVRNGILSVPPQEIQGHKITELQNISSWKASIGIQTRGSVCRVWDKSKLTEAIQDFALGQAVAEENPIKGFEECHHGRSWLQGRGSLEWEEEEAQPEDKDEVMREAAVSFVNRRELEDKGQVGEELTINWPESPPAGAERDPAGRAQEDQECKVLKGLVSIGNPRVTGTERWEWRAWSRRGASGGHGGTGRLPLGAAWFPELITGRPCFLTNALSVANGGGGRKVIKTESLNPPPQEYSLWITGWFSTFHLRTGGILPSRARLFVTAERTTKPLFGWCRWVWSWGLDVCLYYTHPHVDIGYYIFL